MAAKREVPHAGGGVGARVAPQPGDAERWARVKAVFLETVERPDAERGAYLARACAGDDDLRGEVESLLASDEAAASFCETPAAVLLASGSPSGSGPNGPGASPRLPDGTRLGPYEVTAFVAAGGMGEVYRARHTLLGREVAVKTVGARVGGDAARRLLREARHAAVLKHPNVCTIHEIGETADGPFIVMEYVDGRPLSAVLRDGAPEPGTVLSLGIQVADALAHAHRHGIVHRDLKSANVVVTPDGRAVVLDFGLAKRIPRHDGEAGQSHESSLTVQGAVAGTLSHMAPEVLMGGEADARTDVWALGVLLYELATGELPFRGRTPYETSSAILADPPRPMGGRVPLALRLVIARCLMKAPADRYQRAADVGAALEAIRRRRAWPLVGRLLVSVRRRTLPGVAAAIVLVAVLLAGGQSLVQRLGGRAGAGRPVSTLALLPLTNATGDPGAQYYADGLTDALIAELGAAADVRVISRTSATRAARAARSRAEVAGRLGAGAIAEGALRRVADRVAVEMRLVRPSDGRVLWSGTFERGAREVLALQADIVRALALEVRLDVRPGARERLGTVRTVSPEVYEAYLKGRYEWNQRTPESLQRAIAQFTRAVELDPTYAPGHVALADCYNQLGTVIVGGGSPRQYRPRAAAEAVKALQIDPHSAEAHATLGYVEHYEWRWAEAERELRRAIELNPSYPLARIWYANLLMSRRRMPEAVRQVEVARELDPFSLVVGTNVGWVLAVAGRHADAIAQYRRALELDSTYLQARSRLANSLLAVGRTDEALEQARRLVALTRRGAWALATLAVVDVEAGRRGEARALLDELLARSRREYVAPWALVQVHAALGNLDDAMAWAARAFDERSNGFAYAWVEPGRGPLGRDPRFQALLARAGMR